MTHQPILPRKIDDGWGCRFKITRRACDGDPNLQLPVAHTCFFTLELPRYSEFEACRHKILYAITNCRDFQLA